MTDPGLLAFRDQWDVAASDLEHQAREVGDRDGNYLLTARRLPVWLGVYLDEVIGLLENGEPEDVAVCHHLTGSPTIVHAYAGLLGLLVCGGCAASADDLYRRAPGVCDRCERGLPAERYPGVVVRRALALHFRLCRRCDELMRRWGG